MADGIELLNLAAFEARAEAAFAALQVEAGRRLEVKGNAIAEDARTLCPVATEAHGGTVTGELRDSIEARNVSDARGVEVEVGSFGVRYARFVEYGTSKMAAEPFLRPAIAAAKGSGL